MSINNYSFSQSLPVAAPLKSEHDEHIVCCRKQPSFGFQKIAALVTGALGLGLGGWGMSQIAATLAGAVTVGTGAACGAGFVLLAIGLIAWAVFSYIQYKAANTSESQMKALQDKINQTPQLVAQPPAAVRTKGSLLDGL